MIKNGFVYFWGSSSPFSQWHKAKFSENGTIYSSAEQYMMHNKALLFNDEEVAKEIMATDNQKNIKALGRKVKNFNSKIWDANCKKNSI